MVSRKVIFLKVKLMKEKLDEASGELSEAKSKLLKEYNDALETMSKFPQDATKEKIQEAILAVQERYNYLLTVMMIIYNFNAGSLWN